jgi:tetratricopeptide (TPR) repeat protein
VPRLLKARAFFGLDYNQAIELDPEYTHAFNNRGLAYADLKQFEKAIQDYNQVIELNPKDARSA